jgi:heavy metal sensor kinase
MGGAMAGRSISSRLTIWFSSVYFAGLALFGIAMWFNLEHTLTQTRSRTLERRADRLIEVLRKTEDDLPQQREKKFRDFAEATGGGLMEVFHPDRSRALPSPSQDAASFPWSKSAWPRSALSGGDKYTEMSFGGQPYLVLERPWLAPAGPFVLSVAAPLETNLTLLRTFRGGMLWTVPVLLALSALGGYFLSRQALRPVDEIALAARSISVMNLSERLPVPATNDELQRLSETCNAMLARLDFAVSEIKRFTADASHELRTPVSVIRTLAELALRNPGADEESRRAFAEIVEEAGRTSRLLEEMLVLARADDGTAHLSFEPVDVAEILRVVGAKARLLAESNGHTLDISLPAAELPLVRGDYSMLHRLLWILLDNAVKYTRSPGNIRIVLRESGEMLVIEVRDTGIGISPSDLPHIFKRFYRGEQSRSQIDGSGLGLAIAHWIADTHQAELSAESQGQGGTVFRISIPVVQRSNEPQSIANERPDQRDRKQVATYGI